MEKTVATLEEGAYISGGAVLSAYFLDADTFFAKSIAANPAFTQEFIYQHWGGIIAVGAAWGSTKIDSPVVKAIAIGVMIYGILVEARNDFGWDNSTTPPNPRWGMMGGKKVETKEIDAKLRALAEQARAGGSQKLGVGSGSQKVGVGRITRGYTGVGRITRGYTGVGRR